jgi:hypothetical protein
MRSHKVSKKARLKREWYREMRRMGVSDKGSLNRIWELLDRLGKVDEVVDQPPDMALENLLTDAESCLEYAEKSQSQPSVLRSNRGEEEVGEQEDGDGHEEIHFQLSGLQRERAAAFEEHVARIAANYCRVRSFRERVLGGRLLTPEQARALIHSSAAQVFSPRQFSNWSIPLVDHTAELKGTEETLKGNRVVGGRFTVYVEPPGMERAISRRLRQLPFVNENGSAESITVGEGSVLGELAALADRLHANYPWESKADIVHFLLTGTVPAIPPVTMHYKQKRKPDSELSPGGFRYGTIILEVAPWIRAKTVEAAFRDAKRQVSRNRKYRRLEEKSLKMIRFVAQYDEPPQGRQLLEAWNAQELVKRRIDKDPTWYYDPDKRGESSQFWRDYHRARRSLVYDKRPRVDRG